MKKLLGLFCFFSMIYGNNVDFIFDMEMGKNTKCFNQIQTKEDFEKFSKYKQNYSEKINLKKGNGKISHVLHFIWLNPRKIPSKYLKNIDFWKKKHPNWEVKLWLMKKMKKSPAAIHLISEFPFFKLADFFWHTTNFVEKEKIFAFELLNKEGGIVIHPSVQCKKNMDDLSQTYDFFSVLSLPQSFPSGCAIALSEKILASSPSHPVIIRCMDKIKEKWSIIGKAFPFDDYESKIYKIWYRTYMSLEESVFEKAKDKDIIFPAQYIFPVKGQLSHIANAKIDNEWVVEEKKNKEKILDNIFLLKKKACLQLWLFSIILCLVVGIIFLRFYLARESR